MKLLSLAMKLLSLAAVVCMFSSLLVAQHTTVFHSAAPGAFASVTINNTTSVDIEVDRGDTSTFLDFFVTAPGPNGGFTLATGSGTIPNSDFVTNGSSLQQMALNVDTSQVPGFNSNSCTISFIPFFTATLWTGPFGVDPGQLDQQPYQGVHYGRGAAPDWSRLDGGYAHERGR